MARPQVVGRGAGALPDHASRTMRRTVRGFISMRLLLANASTPRPPSHSRPKRGGFLFSRFRRSAPRTGRSLTSEAPASARGPVEPRRSSSGTTSGAFSRRLVPLHLELDLPIGRGPSAHRVDAPARLAQRSDRSGDQGGAHLGLPTPEPLAAVVVSLVLVGELRREMESKDQLVALSVRHAWSLEPEPDCRKRWKDGRGIRAAGDRPERGCAPRGIGGPRAGPSGRLVPSALRARARPVATGPCRDIVRRRRGGPIDRHGR